MHKSGFSSSLITNKGNVEFGKQYAAQHVALDGKNRPADRLFQLEAHESQQQECSGAATEHAL